MSRGTKGIRWHYLMVAVLAAFLVGACNQGTQTTDGGGQEQGQEAGEAREEDEAQSGGGETEACKLTAKADIEAAAGEPVKDGVESKGSPGKYDKGEAECSWEYANKPGLVAVRYWNDTKAYDYYKQAFANGESVSGVGSEAFYTPGVNLVTAKVDGKTLQVQAPDQSRTKDHLVTLAKAAAENL